MKAGFFRGGLALSHLLDEINAAARAIELITKQLVCGASCCAEAAVDAFTKNACCLYTFWRIGKLWSELSLHIKTYERRLVAKTPAGSKAALRRD